MKILLDYVFPVTVITPTAAASTGFLKSVTLVAKPKAGQEGNVGTIYQTTSMTQVAARTNNTNAQQLFNAGLSKVNILLSADLLLSPYITDGLGSDFYTLLISDDYSDANVTALTKGTWEGVIGVSSTDETFLATQAAIENRVPFLVASANGAKNMMYAFGKLLANPSNWTNQQYITMPFSDGVASLGDANSYFDSKINFVLSDSEFGNRLALFSAAGKAIIAPYVSKNLRVDLQSKALQWISANQPSYTLKEAALLETRLQEDVINSYILRNWIDSGSLSVSLRQNNFVANCDISVSEPKALWRVFSELRQTV